MPVRCTNPPSLFADYFSLDFQLSPEHFTVTSFGQDLVPQEMGPRWKSRVFSSDLPAKYRLPLDIPGRPGRPPGRLNKPPSANKPEFSPGNEMKHRCEACGKVYTSAAGLYYHMANHTGVYKFTCDICNKGFMQNQKYQAHIKVHQKQIGVFYEQE